jgi:hypothetical protein
MKNFEEKAIIDLSQIAGGAKIEDSEVCFTIHWDGFFNGNLNLFYKIKGNSTVDELD